MDKSPSSTHTKRSFYRKKQQQTITEHSTAIRPTTLMPTYLTTESIRKISPIDSSRHCGNMQIKQVEKNKSVDDKLIFFF
jgi:hypothetical protein